MNLQKSLNFREQNKGIKEPKLASLAYFEDETYETFCWFSNCVKGLSTKGLLTNVFNCTES